MVEPEKRSKRCMVSVEKLSCVHVDYELLSRRKSQALSSHRLAHARNNKSDSQQPTNDATTTSTSPPPPSDNDETRPDSQSSDANKMSIFQRFRQTYKEHGKVLVGVHLITSAAWISCFYYAALSGVDVVPILKWFGASDKVIAPFLQQGVGNAAVTYLMYKIATPIRYTVTIAGTHVMVRYLRRRGYLPNVPEHERFRSLAKEKYNDFKEKRHKH